MNFCVAILILNMEEKSKLLSILCFIISVSSVQSLSCVQLCDPKDWSTPGFPVLHYLLELAQTHVHWVSDAIQPSLSSPSPAFYLSQHQAGSFPMSQLFVSGGQSIGASASASVLPVNIQGWFPLELTGLISLQSKWLFSSTTVQKQQFFSTRPSSWPNSHHTWLLEKS